MNIIAVALPDDLHRPVRAAYPEHDWTFVTGLPAPAVTATRRVLGLKRSKGARHVQQIFALWAGVPGGTDATAAQLRGDGAEVLMLHPGAVSPEMAPDCAAAMGVRGFVLLAQDAATPPADAGAGRLLPPELADAGVPGGDIHFARPGDLVPLLATLPPGHVLDTTGHDMHVAQRIALHRRGIAALPADIGPGQGLRMAASIITRDALTATLARLIGRTVILLDAPAAANGPLRAALMAGGAAAEALLTAQTRWVDLHTDARLEVADLRMRVRKLFLPGSDDALKGDVATLPDLPDPGAPLSLVVGHPDGVMSPPAQLFGAAGVIQTPPGFNVGIPRKNPEVFHGQNLILWYRMPSPDWVRDATGDVRVLSRYPAGVPMHLGRDKGFFPVLSCDPVRAHADGDGFAIRYDLARDLDALDQAERRQLRELGRTLRPDLKRLQSVWRVQRHDVFAMTRQLGFKDAPRLLVLGREAPQTGLQIQTNPEGIDDVALVTALVAHHPEADIVYQPHDSAARDTALIAAITGLSPRVRIIASAYEVSELALVVDEIHTVDSPLGLAAILSERPVTVHGTPAYCGLGVTRDLMADGRERPALATRPADLALFVGWHYTRNVIFVDPLTGQRAAPADYAAKWYPARGAMRGDIADAMVARALGGDNIAFRDTVLQLLQMVVAHDHVRAFLDALDMDGEIAAHPDSAIAAAEAHAGLGDWRLALRIVARVSEAHGSGAIGVLAPAVAQIRARLHDTGDRALFGPYLLTLLRKMPAANIDRIARALMAKRFFGAALILLRSIRPTEPILAAICRCQIGRSDPDGARGTIADMVARGMSETQIEDLTLTLDETTGRWDEACRILSRRMRETPDDLDLTLRHADACAQAGANDEAHDLYIQLMRTTKSTAAIHGLITLELARMNVATARALLEAYLATSAPNGRLFALMGDCLSFENDLEGACAYYYKAVMLNALDTTAYTRLRALEDELAAAGLAPDPLWSARYRAHVAQSGGQTVEALLGEGRLALLDNDTETMRRNAARAVALFPNDMRAHAWLGHAMAWSPGQRSPAEIDRIVANYRASISAGAEDGWWTSYDFVRSLAFLGQTDEIARLMREQHQTLFVGQKARTGWPRFMAGAALSDLTVAFEGLRDFPRSALIRKYARNFRLADSIEEVRPGEKVLFLSEGGVGDEIRYAIPYPELIRRFPGAKFSVDERIAPLYRRSFPGADFMPLPRFHRKRMNRDLLPHIDDLPDQALAQFFDNGVWAAAQQVDVVVPAPSVMADLRPAVASFDVDPRPRLVPDHSLVADWSRRLRPYDSTLLVGVIGTSRILEYQRIANYFTPDEMADIYRLPGVTFVSLEYEDDAEMADYIRSAFGASLLTFPDLDKMDDFDGVLALSHALDCVVGVNTATIELTAFGGVETIFAAPNAHHIWRDPHGTGQDLFFDTMQVVLCHDPHEKPQVSARIAATLEERRVAKIGRRKAAS